MGKPRFRANTELVRSALSFLTVITLAHRHYGDSLFYHRDFLALVAVIPACAAQKALNPALLIKASAAAWLFWKESINALSLLVLALVVAEIVVIWPSFFQSFFSYATLSFLNPAIESAYKNGAINYDDIPHNALKVSTEKYACQLEANLEKEITPRGLFISILRSFRLKAALFVLAQIGQRLLKLLGPILMVKFIHFVDQRHNGKMVHSSRGLLLAVAMFVISIVERQLTTFDILVSDSLQKAIRTSFEAAIFKKIVRLSRESREEYPISKVVTLMSSKLMDISLAPGILFQFFAMTVEFIFCLVALYKSVGSAVVGGLFIGVVLIPLNKRLVRNMANTRRELSKITTLQTQRINDLFSAIKTVKLYAWEPVLVGKIFEIHDKEELSVSRKYDLRLAFCSFFWSSQPFLISFSTLSWYSWVSKTHLSAEALFPIKSLLLTVEHFLTMAPMLWNIFWRSSTSFAEVAAFLMAPEVQLSFVSDDSESAIDIRQASFGWAPGGKVAFESVDLQVQKGEFVTVSGQVGSGKLALLSAILGELYLNGGTTVRNGRTAYASQNPVIFLGTLRDNVLFGRPFNQVFYNAVLSACQLDEDIQNFKDHDRVSVGLNGAALSGGQKARISLARAIYSDADIFILDDVLSAVDNHVSGAIVESLFGAEGILTGKTVVMATNNPLLVGIALRVVQLEKGVILSNEVGGGILRGLSHFMKSGEQTAEKASESSSAGSWSSLESTDFSDSEYNPLKEHLLKLSPNAEKDDLEDKGDVLDDESLAKPEKLKQPSLKKSAANPYLDFFNTFSKLLVVSVFSLLFAKQLLDISADYWLARWTDESANVRRNFARFAALGIITDLTEFLRNFLVHSRFSTGGKSSYFRRMVLGLSNAPAVFFDKTPVGTILSRFNNDLESVSLLPRDISNKARVLLYSGSSLAVLAYNTPLALPLLLPAFAAYWYYQKVFASAQKQFTRLLLAAQAPGISLAQQAFTGAEVLRAFGATGHFAHRQHLDSDFNVQATLLVQTLYGWLTVRTSFYTASVEFFCCLYFVVWGDSVSGALVAFVFNYAGLAAQSFGSLLEVNSNWAAKFVPVEQCIEFANLPGEAGSPVLVEKKPFLHPSDIVFENYSATYEDEAQPVLKNVNLSIKAGQKVGVVGRTGAGKSSIVLALFRMLKKTSGRILVDGVNLEEFDLASLRSSIGIVPQDLLLFLGLVRENIDPLNEYLDESIWKALADANLKTTIEDLGGLESPVSEAGSNFSGGQKQLLCLVRALLKDSGLVVMDEATASVDSQTEELVRDAVARNGANKTIISIAHRTKTVMDLDMVVGLENGEVREYDAPQKLLARKDSLLYGLVNQAA